MIDICNYRANHADYIIAEAPEMDPASVTKLARRKIDRYITKALPQTTCHYDFHCDHRGQSEPGSYRFSVERREKAMSATHPIGFRGVQSLSKVLKSPTLMGYGKGGEIWIYLTCYEGVLDGKLHRKVFGDGTQPAGLHQLIQWLNFIVPETRSLLGFPGILTLTSPQRHTVYLWVAVHQRPVYLSENPDVKKLLDDGVSPNKAFPSDLFLALNGDEALYLDVETRDFKGCTRNKKIAELRWEQVLERKLSDSLAISDQLVESLESEVEDVSSDDSAGERPQERGLSGEESHQSDNGGVEENESVSETMATVSTHATRIGPHTTQHSTSGDIQTSPRGQKRDHEGVPIAATAAITRTTTTRTTAKGPGTEDMNSGSEKSRIRRAKLAWIAYLHGPYGSNGLHERCRCCL